MAKRKSGRNVHGIVLLDKRLGVSSNKALQEVRRLFDANKAGHTGSLDPMASGLLPLCFGEATKVSGMMLDDDKRYRVVIRLGILTETGDSEGAVLAIRPVPGISGEALQACLQSFTGEIDQIPPMYSALKHNGKKLYELARAGETVARKARLIRIYELKLLDFSEDRLTLEVFCSKGTYIRSLAEDIGHYFGCGGTVIELRRLQAGIFDIKNAKTLEQLMSMNEIDLRQQLIPVDAPLQSLPALRLSERQAAGIRFGQSLHDVPAALGTVRLYHESAFLGLGEMLLDGKLAPRKLFNMTD
ncbi:tRNA pseudouridine(55) synthase TruB [Methylosarcina fibrata]|uniref:tRNA pseudouridine(55) synthase TruB n=1 Tax=Methylosarcina fibrata TaxID=105972 RepID=UPI00035F0D02|nr:tRNA pseudouridine(55) synthase TruB [Methylosarcina fibrata]